MWRAEQESVSEMSCRRGRVGREPHPWRLDCYQLACYCRRYWACGGLGGCWNGHWPHDSEWSVWPASTTCSSIPSTPCSYKTAGTSRITPSSSLSSQYVVPNMCPLFPNYATTVNPTALPSNCVLLLLADIMYTAEHHPQSPPLCPPPPSGLRS